MEYATEATFKILLGEVVPSAAYLMAREGNMHDQIADSGFNQRITTCNYVERSPRRSAGADTAHTTSKLLPPSIKMRQRFLSPRLQPKNRTEQKYR